MNGNKDNSFEKELEELKEWQENRFNPGYYIGSGRVPKPLLSLTKYPKILIAFGVLCLIPIPVIFCSGMLSYENAVGLLSSLFFGGAFIYGGIARLKKSHIKK